MFHHIVSSGSKGNCVIVNDVMIDAGVSYNKLKEYLYDIKYLILTHTHGDHMKMKTLQKINERFPNIITIGNYEVHQQFPVNIIANENFPIEVDGYTFRPFRCVHDVLCYGYVWKYGDLDIFYATDTSSLEYAPDGLFDYFFIESNHDEEKLKQAIAEFKGGYNPYTGGQRHLSTQNAKLFYYLRRKSKESHFIELHKSNRFY